MLIAHITDFHIVEKGKLAYGIVDSRARLDRAIEAVLRLEPRPDAVLVTGDLVDKPNSGAYSFVRTVLDRLPMPVHIVPGNHDARSMLLEHFPHLPTFGAKRFVGYAVEDFPVRLVGADTTREGAHVAEFCAERAAWLDHTLAERRDTPTLLFLHHPPIETGVVAMDFLGEDWALDLEAVVEKHRQVVRVACGHHHRAISAGLGRVLRHLRPQRLASISVAFRPRRPTRSRRGSAGHAAALVDGANSGKPRNAH